MKQLISLRVNGEEQQVFCRVSKTLLEVLREDLFLTGSKRGCNMGECGACTVLVDGRPINSCITLAVDVEGREVTTIEGLARGGELHLLQEAFVMHGGAQCGFCTPGMIMAAAALLDENPAPGEDEMMEAISGNVCRCTGYIKIFEAIRAAGRERLEGRDG